MQLPEKIALRSLSQQQLSRELRRTSVTGRERERALGLIVPDADPDARPVDEVPADHVPEDGPGVRRNAEVVLVEEVCGQRLVWDQQRKEESRVDSR